MKQEAKQTIIILVSAMLLLLSFCLGIMFGSVNISFSEFIKDLIQSNTSSSVYRIVYYIRLPRTLAAMLSGMALSVSGIIIQAVLNNSLAAPNIIGVNAGAGFWVLLIIGIFPGFYNFIPIAAILGALSTCIIIYLLSLHSGASKITITLSGIAISSLFTAGMNTIKTFYPNTLYNANFFLIGGFSGISFKNISYTWILIILGLVIAYILSEDIDILLLGDETAKSLGLNVNLLRFILLVIASILAGCAVSISGLLGFVGLIIPHIVRRIVNGNHRIIIIISILLGGSFVILCDLISRCLFAPYELPVGIILSFLGAPFFLFLVLSRKRGAL